MLKRLILKLQYYNIFLQQFILFLQKIYSPHPIYTSLLEARFQIEEQIIAHCQVNKNHVMYFPL